MNLRPDERAAQAEIESDKRFRSGLKTAAELGASTIGGIAGASALSSKLGAFLNDYITPELAEKGISKISPKLGQFLQMGKKAGLDLKSGLQYIKDNLTKQHSDKNIIEQYSPELHAFIQEKIGEGMSPIQAGALAQNDKKFSEPIKKMTKDHKTQWSQILQTVFGDEGALQQTKQQTLAENQGLDPQLAQIMQGIRGSMSRLSGNNLPVYYDTNE